jgi:hypothetical protein
MMKFFEFKKCSKLTEILEKLPKGFVLIIAHCQQSCLIMIFFENLCNLAAGYNNAKNVISELCRAEYIQE